MILLLFLEFLRISENTEIFYQIKGEEKNKIIVMIHGWLANAEMFKEISDSLVKDYQILLFDLPGHGRSSKSFYSNYYVDSVISIIMKLLDTLHIKKFYLLGHSMGGQISAVMAAKYPKKVEKLILMGAVGTKEFFDSFAGLLLDIARYSKVVYPIALFLPKSILLYMFSHALYKKDKVNWEFLNEVYTYQFGSIKQRLISARITQDMFTFYPIDSILYQIECPVLLLWGNKDLASSLKIGNSFKRAIKHSRLVIIHDAGHMMHQECLEEVLKEIRNFLEASSSASFIDFPFPFVFNSLSTYNPTSNTGS